MLNKTQAGAAWWLFGSKIATLRAQLDATANSLSPPERGVWPGGGDLNLETKRLRWAMITTSAIPAVAAISFQLERFQKFYSRSRAGCGQTARQRLGVRQSSGAMESHRRA